MGVPRLLLMINLIFSVAGYEKENLEDKKLANRIDKYILRMEGYI